MAVDMFIDIAGIKGESQDSKHKDEIDVLTFSWGASNSGTTHMGSGSGSGKASFQDLSFTKYIDKASPILLQHAATGAHIAEAKLVVRKAAGTQMEYILFHIKDLIVSSISIGGSGSEDRLTENVSLNFGSFLYKYTEQLKTGGKGATPDFKYDIAANEAGTF